MGQINMDAKSSGRRDIGVAKETRSFVLLVAAILLISRVFSPRDKWLPSVVIINDTTPQLDCSSCNQAKYSQAVDNILCSVVCVLFVLVLNGS